MVPSQRLRLYGLIMLNPRIQDLNDWVINPDPPSDLVHILESLTSDDLVVVMTNFSGPAGRIAWSEFGRRRGFADFAVRMAESQGQLRLSFEAPAKPIHTSPIIRMVQEKK